MPLDQQIILQEIAQQVRPGAHIWLAYSGGIDSTVLLHVLSHSEYKHRVTAVHVNHQLSTQADTWQAHCENVANVWAVDFRAEKIKVASMGRGLEASAREQRYQVFEKLLGADDVVLMGHHAEDQAETFLYRLLRGAGVKGLAAMPRQRHVR